MYMFVLLNIHILYVNTCNTMKISCIKISIKICTCTPNKYYFLYVYIYIYIYIYIYNICIFNLEKDVQEKY